MNQGYSNYETWGFARHVDGDEVLSERIRGLARHLWDAGEVDPDDALTRSERCLIDLSAELHDVISSGNPLEGQTGLYADLMDTAIHHVSTLEVAKRILKEEIEEAHDE